MPATTRLSSDRHWPECDSQLGPEFEVSEGEVVMTLHICPGCREGRDDPR